MTPARLGPITGVTISTPDVRASIEAYERYLGYRCEFDGVVPDVVADFWALRAMAGRRMAVLVPGSGDSTCIRFVEGRAAIRNRIFRTIGWNAMELIVADVDALAQRLRDSPFRIIGPPADLSFSDQIRAMQVVGPAGEVLYLTMAKSQLEAFDLPLPRSCVDRVFIVILGGASLAELQAWFGTHFGLPPAPVIPSVISILSAEYGLPAGHRHSIAALPLDGQCYIELDQMPPAAERRREPAGELPTGIAIVTFAAQQWPDGLAGLRSKSGIDLPPYRGRRALLARGAAGELLELVAGDAA